MKASEVVGVAAGKAIEVATRCDGIDVRPRGVVDGCDGVETR